MFRLRAKRNVWRKLWRLLIRRRMKSSCSDTESHAASDPMQSLKMVTYHLSRQRYLPHVTPQASSWHQNRSHHHHGTAKAKGSFTAKKWFVWWVSAPEFALIVLIISPKNEEHWKWCTERLSVFGGGHIGLQRFVHVQCHFQPLPTELVFAYFDRGSYVYILYRCGTKSYQVGHLLVEFGMLNYHVQRMDKEFAAWNFKGPKGLSVLETSSMWSRKAANWNAERNHCRMFR